MKQLILFSGIEHKNLGWADQIDLLHNIFGLNTLVLSRDNEFNKAVTTGDKYWLSPIISVSDNDIYGNIKLVYVVTDYKLIEQVKRYFDEVISERIHCIFTRKFTDDVDIFELLTRLNSGGLVRSKTIDRDVLDTNQTVRYIT